MSKIIQLVVSADNKLIALCEDGTVWIKKTNEWSEISTSSFDHDDEDESDDYGCANDPYFYKWDDRD